MLVGRDKCIINNYFDPSEQVLEYILKFYDKKGILPQELLVPDDVDSKLLQDYLGIKVFSPIKGKLKKLMDLSLENAKDALSEAAETLKKNDEVRLGALEELKRLLNLSNVSRMESFDNSHLFGTFYVGGMVVFEDFMPLKDEYRKYKIESGVKDDLSAMKEVLYRRYYKVLMENLKKPDLIVMDGGKLQISVAREIVDSLGLNIPIIGLVKDKNHKTSYIMNDRYEVLDVSKDSNLFIFLTRIQEEVHRFAISYHRNIKSKGMLTSLLEVVPGIGEVRRKELLKRFGSLKKLKEATVEELSEVVSMDVAEKLFSYLKEI